MGEIGPVEGHRAKAGGGHERRPRGQPEVGVDDVEPLAAVAAADLAGSAHVRSRSSGRERKQLHIEIRQRSQRLHLIADEAAERRMLGAGIHVGDDERAQGPGRD